MIYIYLADAISAIDDICGTATLFRPVERALLSSERSAMARDARRAEREAYDGGLHVTDPASRFRQSVAEVAEFLSPDGSLPCKTRRGVKPIKAASRIADELNDSGLCWVQATHVREAQRLLSRAPARAPLPITR